MPRATKTRFACSLDLALLCLGLAVASPAAPAEVMFKSGKVEISERTTREFLDELKARPAGALHGLVELPASPTAAEREKFALAGLYVLSPVYSTIYRVRVEAKWLESLARAQSLPTVRLANLKKEHRVDPELHTAPAMTDDVTVRIHRGITGQQLAGFLSKIPQAEKQSDETWLVTLTKESLWKLAEDDIVQWIDKGPPPFKRENALTRRTVRADSVQKWSKENAQIRGLGGQDIQVGVFDLGIDEKNNDLKRRNKDPGTRGKERETRVIRDSNMPMEPQASLHGTLMAGIIAGDGTMSDNLDASTKRDTKGKPYQWRGMAPLAEVIDINRRNRNGPNGANAEVHRNFIIKFGMDISNHSYIVNTDGSYDNSNQSRDQIIRGDASSEGEPVPARLHVMSAGNEEPRAYFNLTKQVKNALVVTNWDAGTKRLHVVSSLGPTLDGRIKPDVAAPGTSIRSTAYCPPKMTAESAGDAGCFDYGSVPPKYITRHDFYSVGRAGTSQAAAVTTGALALVLEKYIRTYKVALDWNPPLPSTLRAVMIHTARDSHSRTPWIDPPNMPVWPKKGPDFATGWGLIDTRAAVRTIGARHLLEDAVTGTCEEIEYSFVVPQSGKGRVRVTLAWDDVTADAALGDAVPKLVNDLDLVLIDPRDRRHYPWQLDQKMENSRAHCGSAVTIERRFVGNSKTPPTAPLPSAQRGPDHLNNVEVVDAPRQAGVWKARVLAFNIPLGPQKFSLIGAAFGKVGTATAAAPIPRRD